MVKTIMSSLLFPEKELKYGQEKSTKGILERTFAPLFKGENELLAGSYWLYLYSIIYRESDNDVVGIEINPRFGGGYPLSYYAKLIILNI